MPTYSPKYKPGQLTCGEGIVAIITGWTVRKVVASKLEKTDYAVVGQLYSPTRGINLLLRNLLLNPHVRYLIILNATREDKNAGSQDCLKDFFEKGFSKGLTDVGTECWVINSEIPGYIDLDVSEEALTLLRESVTAIEVESVSSAVTLAQKLNGQYLSPWGEPQEFKLEVVEPEVFPGEIYGHRIEGNTIAETWVKIIHRIKTSGLLRPTGYDGQIQELIDLVAVVKEEPESFYIPEPNFLPCDRSFIEGYIPQILDDAPIVEGVKYTYGQRLRSWFGFDQIEQVIDKLIGEIDAASAVMSLWDVKDHIVGGSPCLNHIWVRALDGKLSLTALFRSNDMFSAWPSNAFGLRALQMYIRNQIAERSNYDLTLGPLITISQSAHIYDDCWENADKLINTQYKNLVKPSPQNRDYYIDLVGNFIVELDETNQTIMVTRTTTGSGEVLKTYSGKNPLSLLREICCDAPAIKPDHIGYLGIELQKAFYCLSSGQNYTQDQTK